MNRLAVSTVVAFGLVLALGAPASAADTSLKRAKALFESGVKHYNVGEYKEALVDFKEGYFAKPDPVFLYNMGQAYRQLGEPESAARQYRAFLREQPNAPNRDEVIRFIDAADKELQRRAAQQPPTGVLGSAPMTSRPPEETKPEEPAVTPPPAEPTTVQPATTAVVVKPAPPPPKKRTWLWATIGVVAGVVVVGTVVGVVLATVPNDAALRAGTDPNASVRFP